LAENVLHDYYEQLPGGVELIPGSGGIFEVALNGNVIFSKEETGRFPQENEIEQTLEDRLLSEKPAPPASKQRAGVGVRAG
jgi:selenoprotein W-related protein